jgi:polar amino acid transport system substrate-binding protein
MNKIRLIALLTAALAMFAAGFAQNGTLEQARERGFIRVGFANEVPYAYANPDGTLTGQAVEVARAVFAELGITEMDGVLTEFGSLIPGLQANRFDVITAGMYVTPTRCEQVAFADPEYQIGEGIVVPEGNPMSITSYQDIADNPEIRVGTGAGWLEYDYMVAVGVAENQIVTFPDAPAGMAGLQADRIDVFTGTSLTMREIAGRTNGVTFVEDFEQPMIDGETVISYGAAAFRTADADFRDAYNEVLAQMKEDGRLAEIIEPFGFGATELPGDMTSAEFCGDAYN